MLVEYAASPPWDRLVGGDSHKDLGASAIRVVIGRAVAGAGASKITFKNAAIGGDGGVAMRAGCTACRVKIAWKGGIVDKANHLPNLTIDGRCGRIPASGARRLGYAKLDDVWIRWWRSVGWITDRVVGRFAIFGIAFRGIIAGCGSTGAGTQLFFRSRRRIRITLRRIFGGIYGCAAKFQFIAARKAEYEQDTRERKYRRHP